MPGVHRVGVHDPRHYLFIGVDIGRRNISIRAEDVHERSRIAPGQLLQLRIGESHWIADDSAFGTTKWEIDHGTFPGHPGGQRTYFIQSHVGSVSDAAFTRASRETVLNTITLENLQGAVIHHNGNSHTNLAIW